MAASNYLEYGFDGGGVHRNIVAGSASSGVVARHLSRRKWPHGALVSCRNFESAPAHSQLQKTASLGNADCRSPNEPGYRPLAKGLDSDSRFAGDRADRNG